MGNDLLPAADTAENAARMVALETVLCLPVALAWQRRRGKK